MCIFMKQNKNIHSEILDHGQKPFFLSCHVAVTQQRDYTGVCISVKHSRDAVTDSTICAPAWLLDSLQVLV